MKFAVNWFHNVNLALYSNRIMPDRCLEHGCSNRSDMNAGICAHFSPTIKSERDTWLRFVHTHRANLNPSGMEFVNTRAKRLRVRKVSIFKLAVANANFTTRMPVFELKSNFISIQSFKAGNVKPPGMPWSKDF